jgi:hypothetical protein
VSDTGRTVHQSGGAPRLCVLSPSLFDFLEAGETLDEFLHQFPSVKRDEAVAALPLARDIVIARARRD